MTRKTTLLSLLLVPGLAAGCAPADRTDGSSFDGDRFLERIRTLSSDEFEGRAPGTAGEDRTVAWLTEQFQAAGLQPGNPDGTWEQVVDMVGISGRATASVTVGGSPVSLSFPENLVAISRRPLDRVAVAGSELVFVGYGVEAPEYQWDDYKGLDLTGKTLVMLVNDPAVPDPADSTRLDDAMFRGRAMTYYGRWTYKYEVASAKGAAAAIIIHETGPAGYPWEVVVGSWGRENIDIVSEDRNAGRVGVEAWITTDKARELFAAAGQDFDALKRAAATREFQPVALGARADFTIENTVRPIRSRNVVAKLPGSDPTIGSEYVIYTAHWDHLGRDTTAAGDQIFNGALDNASGTAALLELANAFAALPQAPPRTVLFLAVTAEEKGLLGARYYARNPLYPLERTLANINIDGVNQWGLTRDVVVVGYGNSSLDDVLGEEAARHDRVLAPDPEPEKGFFYRSDHFEFAKEGVPALYTDNGIEYIGKPEGYGQSKREEYTANDYHKPSDEVKPDWDLAGALADLGLLFEVGRRVAAEPVWPTWKPGTEFKATREAMLRRAAGG